MSHIYITVFQSSGFWGEGAECRRHDPAIQNTEEETHVARKVKKSSLNYEYNYLERRYSNNNSNNIDWCFFPLHPRHATQSTDNLRLPLVIRSSKERLDYFRSPIHAVIQGPKPPKDDLPVFMCVPTLACMQ